MKMTRATTPFAIEMPLPERLGAVLDDWRARRRGAADIPFADDVDWERLQELCPDAFMLGVFEKPQRFRVELAATPHAPAIAAELAGRFLDEVDLETPLEFLRAQADAAVESGAPTVYRHSAGGGGRPYARLLLPLWGEGHVSALVGVIAFLG